VPENPQVIIVIYKFPGIFFSSIPNSSQAWKVRAEAAEKELEELRSECKGGPMNFKKFENKI